jgi:hypothetical protein
VTLPEPAALVAGSSLSTLCWVDAEGAARAHGVVALVRGDRPVVAFTYSQERVARAVAAAPCAVLALTEARSTGGAFRPCLITGVPRLVEDPTGEGYVRDLAAQELRRYPPARLFADSPLLMREHWWYLPRLVVELEVARVEPVELGESHPPEDHLLVVAQGDVPLVRPAGRPAVPPPQGRLPLQVLGTPPPAGPAVLFGQDASFPDLDQWEQWRYAGTWDGAALVVERAPARVGLGGPPGLLTRWRRQRDLRRRCLAAIPGR